MEKNGGAVVALHKEKIKVDKIDKKLIALISQNIRFTPKFLGKCVNLSKDGVIYRINKFYKNKLITHNALILNPYSIKLKFFTLSLKIENMPINKEEKIIKTLVNHDFTIWVGSCLGSYNLIAFFILPNKDPIKLLIDQLKKEYKDYINKTKLAEINKLHIYNNLSKWFIEENIPEFNIKKDVSFQYYIKRPPVSTGEIKQIQPKDLPILKNLIDDPRISIASISAKTKIPFNTIKNRIAYLIKNNIILSFNAVINISLLGQPAFALYFDLEKVKESEVEKLKLYLKNNEATGYLFETTNKEFRFELFGSARDNKHIYEIITNIRKKFSFIRNIETITILQDYKFTFAPKGILKLLTQL